MMMINQINWVNSDNPNNNITKDKSAWMEDNIYSENIFLPLNAKLHA